MREITIGKNDAGQRLDRFVSKSLPLLPPALLQKYIRLKRIKCNGARAQRDQRLQEGDILQLYINDEFFDKPREDNLFLTLFKPSLDIVYEDENLLEIAVAALDGSRKTDDLRPRAEDRHQLEFFHFRPPHRTCPGAAGRSTRWPTSASPDHRSC